MNGTWVPKLNKYLLKFGVMFQSQFIVDIFMLRYWHYYVFRLAIMYLFS